jgi:hypothetical protein
MKQDLELYYSTTESSRMESARASKDLTMRNLTMRPRRYWWCRCRNQKWFWRWTRGNTETITKEIDQFNENTGSVAEDGQVEVEGQLIYSWTMKSCSLLPWSTWRACQDVVRDSEEQRRKSRKQNAFRKGNNNKTYVKGKEGHDDTDTRLGLRR